jgi:Protein phosphatase 2C
MKDSRWSWMGASSTGTSHLANGSGCDDAGACIEVNSENGSTLICVVSDGAGSASLSKIGSHIAVRGFCRSALVFARAGKRPKDLDREVAASWLDDVRDRIAQMSIRERSPRRSFAATLVGCFVQSDGLAVLHVGDGACALRLRTEEEWRVPIWPAQGEYASTTNFVTDDPEPNANIAYVSGDVAEVALFTDGLERLALDFTENKPFTPFFTSMFKAMRAELPGRQKQLSEQLRAFLDSPVVTERTDDDKTLIMARQG